MTTLEKRLDALEQAAKLAAAQNKPEIALMNVEALRKRMDEILSREEPELPQAELIQKVKDDIARMHRN